MARFYPNQLPIYQEIKPSKMREYSEGDRLSGGLKFRPAPYLPIVRFEPYFQAGVVIEKGTFVTLDENGFLVPAFVGEKTLTYGQVDVELGVFDFDSFNVANGKNNAVVSAAKTTTKKLGTTDTADVKIGAPIGVTFYDIYQWDLDKDPWYKIQDAIAILCDKAILLAVDQAHANVQYRAGQLLMLDQSGFPVPYDGEPEKLHYVIGRLVKVIDVEKDPDFLGGVQNVVYWPSELRPEYLPGRKSITDATVVPTEGIDPVTKKGLLIQLQL